MLAGSLSSFHSLLFAQDSVIPIPLSLHNENSRLVLHTVRTTGVGERIQTTREAQGYKNGTFIATELSCT